MLAAIEKKEVLLASHRGSVSRRGRSCFSEHRFFFAASRFQSNRRIVASSSTTLKCQTRETHPFWGFCHSQRKASGNTSPRRPEALQRASSSVLVAAAAVDRTIEIKITIARGTGKLDLTELDAPLTEIPIEVFDLTELKVTPSFLLLHSKCV